jgi:hypothetical protein
MSLADKSMNQIDGFDCLQNAKELGSEADCCLPYACGKLEKVLLAEDDHEPGYARWASEPLCVHRKQRRVFH